MINTKNILLYTIAAFGLFLKVSAVDYEQILNAKATPEDWLTYNGTYMSQRYSELDQIDKENVDQLELKWMLQNQVFGAWQSNPIVVNDVMYITQRPNDILALDPVSGRVFWQYKYTPSSKSQVCCGANNRGVAILGDKVFMGTLDAHLVAVDAINGKEIWDVEVGDVDLAYSVTMAPLVIKDKVIVGVGGGEYGIRGYIVAYDVETGQEAWKFYTIPGPGEPGHETWEGDDWKYGGASVWVTGSYDPELNLTYWGIGNPGPDWNPKQRPGDNLYSDSVVALDPDTGELKWHFQFTPNDAYDYDAVQVPVLVDREWEGRDRKLMLWANRNGYFYVLDRVTGQFLLGEPFVKVNWASGLDQNGRPIVTPQPAGMPTWPGNQGGTNWYPPSYSPLTDLFYVAAWEDYATIYAPLEQEYEPGKLFMGGGFTVKAPVHGAPTIGIGRTTPINNWTSEVGYGSVKAIDPDTGEHVWRFDQYDVSDGGMLTTASNILFTGGREGHFHALDAATGDHLWKASLGGQIVMPPVTYEINGVQYITVISGNAMATFALRNEN